MAAFGQQAAPATSCTEDTCCKQPQDEGPVQTHCVLLLYQPAVLHRWQARPTAGGVACSQIKTHVAVKVILRQLAEPDP